MNARLILAGCALQAGVVAAAVPEDFASGMAIDGDAQRPVWQLELPDAVYASVLRPELGDIRVFNADRIAVPHAVCSRAEIEAPLPPQGREVELPVFPLQRIRDQAASSVDVSVRTPQGDEVQVDINSAQPGGDDRLALGGYVIDASALELAVVALRLRWLSSDGASEVPVRVESSEDLERWSVIVPQATLLRLTSSSATLERVRIAVPTASYRYLRLVRVDAGPSPAVEAVIAETVEPTKVRAIPLRWFDAQPRSDAAAPMFEYAAGRRAPVQAARIALPIRNQIVSLRLQSRTDERAAWQTRWQGQQSNIEAGSDARSTAAIGFPPTSDPQWRLQITEGAEAFGSEAPVLGLGYVPEVLRFIAQGQGPFTLAYASATAEVGSRRPCDWWRQTTGGDVGDMLGDAQLGAEFPLGGEAATRPVKPPTLVQRYLLWALLASGAGLLIAMALSLLRRIRSAR
ncbi:MAG TPA: DUF3999 domain-containing protein [Fontimonas sp.]